ncbi:MAG: DegV family protein [Bacilli bacterium]|jgi:DegV family protein with EDD domain|nr:DegV family protein [Bacilli bacterium]
MKIAISAESTIDLQEDMLRKYDIYRIPYTLVLGDKTVSDEKVRGEDIFAFTARTGVLAKTTAVNVAEFEGHFRKLLKDHDAVIHFSLSKAMSSTYNNACLAARSLKNVYVIDSAELSTGIALEAIYARKLIDAGKKADEVVDLVKRRIPFVQASFSLEHVDYLYKGGRCNAMALLGANILNIKPEIIVKNGVMVAGKKDRGPMEKATMSYVENTLAEFSNPDPEEVFITFSSSYELPEIKVLVDRVAAVLRGRGFKNVHATQANATVCCHCGPHTLGILYINDGPHPIV